MAKHVDATENGASVLDSIMEKMIPPKSGSSSSCKSGETTDTVADRSENPKPKRTTSARRCVKRSDKGKTGGERSLKAKSTTRARGLANNAPQTTQHDVSGEKAGGASDNNAEEVTLGMLKDQIGQLAKLVTENIAPVVNNLKEAYDDACEQYISDTESEGEIVEHDDVVDDEQPPRKKVLTDSFLDALEKAVKNDDESGPPIDDRLANIINTVAGSGLQSDIKKERVDLYKKPKNAPLLHAPRVNPGCGIMLVQ